MTAREWREAVFERDGWRCAARVHHQRCPGRAQHAHHIVYKAHLIAPARYLLGNGIALSELCHTYTHEWHNMNLPAARLEEAVQVVNAVVVQSATPELVRPRFRGKLD